MPAFAQEVALAKRPAETKSTPRKSREADDDSGNKSAKKDDDGGVDTSNLFGFTEGSDVNEVGEKELEAETVFRIGKRDGRYIAIGSQFQVSYAPFRNFEVGLGLKTASHHIRDVTALDDRSRFDFDGLALELKYRLIDRTTGPFGLTLIVEPGWGRRDDVSGEAVNTFAIEPRLAADVELIKDRLFGALNVFLESERSRERATGLIERESTIGVSAAASSRVVEDVFVGGEVRYARKYDGLALNTFVGEALFVGPTFYAKIAQDAWIAAAWSVQVAGRSIDTPGRPLDLENFSRHEAKVKVGVNF